MPGAPPEDVRRTAPPDQLGRGAHAATAIEGNTLAEDTVRAIVEKRPVSTMVRPADDQCSVEAENRHQRFVDAPQLLGAEVPCPSTQAASIDSADLFDQHASARAVDLDLGTERSRPCASRRRRDDHVGVSPEPWRTPLSGVPIVTSIRA